MAKTAPPAILGRIKSVHEWLADGVGAVKENKDFLRALEAAAPWAGIAFEAAKDSIGPVKFLVRFFDEFTKVYDPRDLCRIACTLAFQRATEKAFAGVGSPNGFPLPLSEYMPDDGIDFDSFTLEQVQGHAFVAESLRALRFYSNLAGYLEPEVDRILNAATIAFPREFGLILSDARTKEKFEPLRLWLQLDSTARYVRASLRRHGDYLSWLFHYSPVLGTEPYGLSEVYVDTDCRKTTHAGLKEKKEAGEARGLLDTVIGYVSDRQFKDAIVIQGVAGVGKSSFTLRLADELRGRGLTPIRIRLRDLNVDQEFFASLGKAMVYSDEKFQATPEVWNPPGDVFQGGALLRQTVLHEGFAVCPYVLILDGWDEISVAVSEGYRVKVERLLLEIRRTVLGGNFPKVPVILTGRPLDVVEDCSAFYLDDTPVLLMEPLRVGQLREFAGQVREAQKRQASDWALPVEPELEPLFQQYHQSRANEREIPVLGVPFLAHLALRLFSELPEERSEIASSATTLLRRLTDYATRHAQSPSDKESVRVRPRFAGGDLRTLLHRTAAAMTVYGRDSIPREELESRLEVEDLAAEVRAMKKEHVLSTLLISFYFKAGSTSFGCEFAHKSLREYLFAEHLVEILKRYGREVSNELPKRTPYWKDFEPADPRYGLVRALGDCLCAQWMRPEVYYHLQSLIAWEIERAAKKQIVDDGQSSACRMEEWLKIHAGLVDAWDWWGEGVPQRCQPTKERGGWKLEEPYLVGVSKDCLPRIPADRNLPPQPPRVVTMDAHLGDGIFRLIGLVHDELHRRKGGVRFRPSGEREEYLRFYIDRIKGCGWYPWGTFPKMRWMDLRGVDLRGLDMREADFVGADLSGADLRHSTLIMASFDSARLDGTLLDRRHQGFFQVIRHIGEPKFI